MSRDWFRGIAKSRASGVGNSIGITATGHPRAES